MAWKQFCLCIKTLVENATTPTYERNWSAQVYGMSKKRNRSTPARPKNIVYVFQKFRTLFGNIYKCKLNVIYSAD